jgi:vancomycin resistance protein YoaR
LATLAVQGQSRHARRRKAQRRLLWQRTAVAVGAIAIVVGVLGLAFAGSPARVPTGVQVAGVPVGGLTPVQARHKLERLADSVSEEPVVFLAGGRRWRLTAKELEVRVNWRRAVSSALQQGDGPVPVRGFRRLGVRLFGADITPTAQAYDPALQFELDRISRRVNRQHQDASLSLHRGTPVVTAARNGLTIDRNPAARTIVQALASLERPLTVRLPVKIDPPLVTTVDLRPVATQLRTVLSAPVRLVVGRARFEVAPYRIARVLDLPHGGNADLRITSLQGDPFLARLSHSAERPPRDADFEALAHGVRLIPARDGISVNAAATGRAILAAALSTTNRVAHVALKTTHPSRTTAEARKLGIHNIVGTYTTIYGGIPNRIHNVQLVAHLINHHFIAPGEEFSFNKTTGVRDASKGFLEAPVIINGELQTGLGGGVCQVSTTVFNAAYEAGLKITARTNHALYISHYPLGRDATVNYPDTDLRFVNDTKHWLLLRTFVGSSSLTVTLYGTTPHRRVDTTTAPLTVTGPVPVQTTPDPTLPRGQTVVETAGSPPLETSVERKVYTASGRLLYDDRWASHYVGETQIERVGTKKPTPPPPTTTTKTTGTTSTTRTTTTTSTTKTTTTQTTTTPTKTQP